MSLIKITVLISFLIIGSDGARILGVFPFASISHQVVFRGVIKELVTRGHDVTVITPDPAFPKGETPTNLTEINTHAEAYAILRKKLTETVSTSQNSGLRDQVIVIENLIVHFVEQILLNEEVREMINDEKQKFDLLLLESCAKPALIFSHIYKAPVIQISSFGAKVTTYPPFGVTEHPIVYPLCMNRKVHNLSLWDKFLEIYNYLQLVQIFKNHERESDEMFKKFYGAKAPSVTHLQNNVDMLFLNVHPIFEGIRPVPPTVQYMAGLHQNIQKKLPQSVIVCYVANMSVRNVFFFAVLLATSEAARILAVFPVPSISHQVVFRPVIQELVKRGHEVIVITADPAFPKDQTPANLTEIDTHEESYRLVREQLTNSASKGSKSDFVEQVTIIENLIVLIVEQIMVKEEVRKIINDKTEKFDLLILEACAKPNLIFSHIYKVPVVQFSSFGGLATVYELFGAPEHPILYPLASNLRLNNLTKWDKILEIYNYYRMLQLFKDHNRQIDEMYLKLFGPNIPPVAELVDNVDMLFLNIHPIFEGIRPVPPSIKYVAGLHQKPHMELPKDLQKYLDSSKNGVIYFSFGTNVDPTLLSPEKVKLFVTVLSKLPYDVLWKWNGDDLPGRTENIKISKWLPQSDLLRHPKVKVFITQGGLQSTDEAITAGVPLVGIPMLGDQWFNVERYVYHNIGVGLDFETLTEDDFRNAILKVIEDESYRENIIKLRTLMKDEPVNSLEKSIWWIEYVIRHGGAKHLRSPGANVSWTQFLELELVLIVLAVFIIALSLLGTVLYAAHKYVKSYLICKLKVA